MPLYKCEKCDKEFNKKSNFNSHLNKKNPCFNNPNNEQILNNKVDVQNVKNTSNDLIIDNLKKDDDIICTFCETKFTRMSSLQRHIKERCKTKIYLDELEKLKVENNKILSMNVTLIKELDKLKKENEKLKAVCKFF